MPLAAIGAALLSALIHASWNAALKGGRGDRIADSFLIAIAGLALSIVLVMIYGLPPAAAWPLLALSVVFHLLYWVMLFKSYEAGDLSHIYTLARGAAPLLVAIGAGLAADEIPAPLKAAGIVLVCVGVLLVGASPNAPLRATLWALATGVCIAAYSLTDAIGARVTGNALHFLGWATGLMALPMIGFALWRRGAARLLRDGAVAPLRGLGIGLISYLGYGLVLWAQTFAPIAQVTALRETSVVFAALIAWLFLGERLGARRWLGAAVVAAGAGLIAFA